jgi:small subunit ribosomal protein S20
MFISYLGGLALANIVSAKKRARQSLIRRDRNQQMKKAVRGLEKKVRTAISAKDKDGAMNLLKQYSSAIDKAATKGKYHPRTASRKISRLTMAMNKALNA